MDEDRTDPAGDAKKPVARLLTQAAPVDERVHGRLARARRARSSRRPGDRCPAGNASAWTASVHAALQRHNRHLRAAHLPKRRSRSAFSWSIALIGMSVAQPLRQRLVGAERGDAFGFRRRHGLVGEVFHGGIGRRHVEAHIAILLGGLRGSSPPQPTGSTKNTVAHLIRVPWPRSMVFFTVVDSMARRRPLLSAFSSRGAQSLSETGFLVGHRGLVRHDRGVVGRLARHEIRLRRGAWSLLLRHDDGTVGTEKSGCGRLGSRRRGRVFRGRLFGRGLLAPGWFGSRRFGRADLRRRFGDRWRRRHVGHRWRGASRFDEAHFEHVVTIDRRHETDGQSRLHLVAHHHHDEDVQDERHDHRQHTPQAVAWRRPPADGMQRRQRRGIDRLQPTRRAASSGSSRWGSMKGGGALPGYCTRARVPLASWRKSDSPAAIR